MRFFRIPVALFAGLAWSAALQAAEPAAPAAQQEAQAVSQARAQAPLETRGELPRGEAAPAGEQAPTVQLSTKEARAPTAGVCPVVEGYLQDFCRDYPEDASCKAGN